MWFESLRRSIFRSLLAGVARAGEMIPEVKGTRPWGPRRKVSPSVSKGPKPPIQLLQLLKNPPREVKRPILLYLYWVPPWSHKGNGIYGARRGRSLPVPPVSPAMEVVYGRGSGRGQLKSVSGVSDHVGTLNFLL